MKRTKQKPKNKVIVLACDPSIRGWGIAVVTAKGKVLFGDCIKTKPTDKKLRIRKGDDSIRRIEEINARLLWAIQTYKVKYIVSELPHGSQSSSAADAIGMCKGIMQTMAQTLDIPIDWFNESDAKKALLRKETATKAETINAITKEYKVPWTGVKYKDEAVADAMAIYHVATKQSSFLQFYKNKKK